MTEIEKLLSVPDMTEEEQVEWVETHCEMEGYSSKESTDELNIWVITESLADLAFRLNDDKIAAKKPIEWIIDALLKEEKKKRRVRIAQSITQKRAKQLAKKE